MKRSEINKIIDYTIDKAEFFKIPLPPFAFYTLEDWKKVTSDEAEIVDNMLGWDITDFGTSDFEHGRYYKSWWWYFKINFIQC